METTYPLVNTWHWQNVIIWTLLATGPAVISPLSPGRRQTLTISEAILAIWKVRMNLAATYNRLVFLKCRTPLSQTCQFFLSGATSSTDSGKPLSIKRRGKHRKNPPWADHLSWEERLADVVTPLWRLSYDEQLERKQKRQERILYQLSRYLIGDLQSPSHGRGKPNFPVLHVQPSPIRDGYRNKSTFSVNKGIDGNPKNYQPN